jgi:hypothetical protein
MLHFNSFRRSHRHLTGILAKHLTGSSDAHCEETDERHGLGMCKGKLASGYEIRAANLGIIQQRFIQMHAECANMCGGRICCLPKLTKKIRVAAVRMRQ